MGGERRGDWGAGGGARVGMEARRGGWGVDVVHAGLRCPGGAQGTVGDAEPPRLHASTAPPPPLSPHCPQCPRPPWVPSCPPCPPPPQGSLQHFLRQHVSPWAGSARLALSLARGLAFLHQELWRDGETPLQPPNGPWCATPQPVTPLHPQGCTNPAWCIATSAARTSWCARTAPAPSGISGSPWRCRPALTAAAGREWLTSEG